MDACFILHVVFTLQTYIDFLEYGAYMLNLINDHDST